MNFNRPPKAMNQPQEPERQKLVTLEQLTSESPIQGLGFKRFTENEKTDLDALLSSAGISTADPVLQNLKGEDLMDIMEYVRSSSHSPERARSASMVKAAIDRVQREYYREAE